MRKIKEASSESVSLDLFTWDGAILAFEGNADYRRDRPTAIEQVTININASDLSLTEQSIKNAICNRLGMDYAQFYSFYFSKKENRLELSALLSLEQVSKLTNAFKKYDFNEMDTFAFEGTLEIYVKAYRSLSEDDVENYTTFKIDR